MNFLIVTLLNGYTLFLNPDVVVGMVQQEQSCSVMVEVGNKKETVVVKERCIDIAGQEA